MRNFNIYLESGQKINLTEHDLSNSGGEGEIFLKDKYAYKIFFDKNKSIETDKIKELSELDRDNIIRPIQPIYNENSEQIGYQMSALKPEKCYPLTRFFTSDFRQQHNITNEQVTHIIREIYSTFEFIHKKGFLIVDGNEMNFLISDDFKNIYFIDVDSYKTPSFNPTAYNPNTLDPYIENQKFNEGSDWYIFGILFCQIVLGIHPFKGKYTGTSLSFGKRDIEKRMRLGVSVLHPKVKLNKAVRSLSLIPQRMKEWLEILFTSEKRVKPPLLSDSILSILKEVDIFNVPDGFKTYEAYSFNQEVETIKTIGKEVVYRKDGYYYSIDDKKLSQSTNNIININGNLSFVKCINGNVDVYIPNLNIKQNIMNNVDKIEVFNEQLFTYKNNKITSINMIVANNKIIAGVQNSWDLFHHQTVNNFMLFYQSGIRKAYYFYEDNKNAILDIEKMVDKNEKIVNIKGYKEYIVLKTFKNNEYYCKIFYVNLFSKNIEKLFDNNAFESSINFVYCNNLLIGEINDEDLIIGYYKDKQFKSKVINNFSLHKEFFRFKDKLSFIEKDKIYNLSMN